MTIFASIHPESLNTDPAPFVRPSDGARGDFMMHARLAPGEHGVFGRVEKLHYTPRPEFTPATTHPHNRVLDTFRNDPERGEAWAVRAYLTALDEYQNHPDREFDEDSELRLATYHAVSRCGASPEEVQHAITVLTRLESWAATPIRYRTAGEQLRAAAGRLGAHITPRHDEDGTVHIDAEQVLTLTVVVTRMALSSRDGTKAYTLLGAMRPREATLSLSAHQVTQLTDALNRIAVAAEQDRARRHSSWAK